MPELYHIADKLGNALHQKGLTITTAESCTAGGVAYALTSVPNSSAWFTCGWVTYSNTSKQELLGVPFAVLEQYGAVSEEVACAMAQGARQRAKTDCCIAITGIAGPAGGTPLKPVGTVWVAWADAKNTVAHCLHLMGDREAIRKASILAALTEAYALWSNRT